MKQKYRTYTTILIILLLGFLFHYKYINEFPSHIHAWTQSDRYALSIGFQNNNLNFFKPETFVMNHQFPDNWKVPSDNSITAVDFPIHDFIPAVIMKISGYRSPWIFRLYILLYSFVGLFFLHKITFLISKSFIKSILILIFAATSPVFVYYQGGFLPTIPSLSNAIIGLYFYVRYLYSNDNKQFNICLLFFTLSALSRTTFSIPLIAIFGLEFIRLIKKEAILKPKILPVVLSILIISSYFLFNNYLRNEYGSIFLNHFLPATSIEQAKEILKMVYERWGTQYFSQFHYLLYSLFLLTSLFFIFFKKRKINNEISMLLLLTAINFVGCIGFALLMLRQFPDHDYYFIDTFFLPIILSLILFVSIIPNINKQKHKVILTLFVFLSAIPLVTNAVRSQNNRRVTGFWDRMAATIENFNNSSRFLDSLGIAKNAKILVIDAYAPNIPFILMDRKGYAILSTKKEVIENSLSWKYDFIVLQKEFFLSDIYSTYPDILSRITKIAENDNILICKLSDNYKKQTLLKFLGLENKAPVFQAIQSYDSIPNKSWQNTQSTSDIFYSANKSGVLTPDMTYGLTYKTVKIKGITEVGKILYLSSYFFAEKLNDCEIVVSINENGNNVYYKSFNLKELLKEKRKWEKVDLLFQLPQINNNDYELGIYLWNTGKSNLYIDDFTIKIY